jgi:hypothetical protein
MQYLAIIITVLVALVESAPSPLVGPLAGATKGLPVPLAG